MTLLTYKLFAALLILLASLATIIYPLKHHARTTHAESFELGEALASGIFLGVAFFHMLPEAISSARQLWPTTHFPIAESICMGSFLLFLFLERLSLMTSSQHTKYMIPYVLVIMLALHSLIEGAALGINTTFAEALIIFIAIIAHKGSESFALCVTLMRHEFSFRKICWIILLFCLITPLGIFLGESIILLTHSNQGKILATGFNAIAAGTFLYMSTLHHIRFHQHAEEDQGLLAFFFLVLGLVTMWLVAWVN